MSNLILSNLNKLILFIITIIIVLSLLTLIRHKINSNVENTKCATSVNRHLVEARSCLKLDSFLPVGVDCSHITPVSCTLKHKTVSATDFTKTVLSDAYDMWRLMHYGAAVFYPGLNKERFCFPYEVIDVKEPVGLNYEDFTKLPVSSYINSMKLDNEYSSYGFIDYLDKTHNNNAVFLFNNLMYSNTFFTYTKFFYLDPDSNIPSLDMSDLNPLKTTLIDMQKDVLSPTDNQNLKNKYVILFVQESSRTTSLFEKIINKVLDKLGIIKSYTHPFVSSSIVIMPYNVDFFKKLDCSTIPFRVD